MNTAVNFAEFTSSLPNHVQLIVVTKFQEIDKIVELYSIGHRSFAENKVQEIIRKKDLLPSDITWHMIGHLQSNKVKHIAPFISMIHSVDSLKLLEEINKQAEKYNRIIDCLLQFHIATEETKFGLDLKEAIQILNNNNIKSLHHIRICGVMGMASFSNDLELVRNEFKSLHSIFLTLKNTYFTDKQYFKEISMGMSNDFKIAIEEGSTMLRIGSLIFHPHS